MQESYQTVYQVFFCDTTTDKIQHKTCYFMDSFSQYYSNQDKEKRDKNHTHKKDKRNNKRDLIAL